MHSRRLLVVDRLSRVLLIIGILAAGLGVAAPRQASAQGITGLHVSGNRILNGAGQQVFLRGVNRSGTEYACIQGWGFFDGPSDPASVRAIVSWKTNAVRVPLNEDCWLGINGAPAKYSGANYRAAISSYVSLLIQAGLVPILELHWSAAGTAKADRQQPMPNRDHSPTFWRQVADAYKGNTAVVFELFNEPYPDNNRDTDAAWRCWRDGGSCPGMAFQAAGMQELLNAVRSTGAKNLVLLGGVQYSNALSRWLQYKPTDPANNVAAAWHVYNFNACNTSTCWNSNVAPVARTVPLVATEIGQSDGQSAWVNGLMNWLDSHQASYLAWVWDVWGGSLDLIKSYDGTPTDVWGKAYKAHLAAVADSTPPVVSVPSTALGVGRAFSGGLLPLHVAWSASDSSGVTSYQLQQKTDSGAYYSVGLPTATTRSTVRMLYPAHSYTFRVRARDGAGNWSGWVYSRAATIQSVQDSSASIVWSGRWSLGSSSAFYGGSTHYATAAGSTATFRFTGGRQATWASARGPGRGYARVYVDGVLRATVSLYASSLQSARNVFAGSVSGTTTTAHTVRIYVTGTKPASSVGTRVDADGFLVLR